jgi:hypothetical protein
VINDCVCTEVAHGRNIVPRYGCDGFQARATGQLNRIGSNIASCSVNDLVSGGPNSRTRQAIIVERVRPSVA